MNYYQFHIADFALHTSHLTLEEEAVYRRILDYYYDTESPIPKKTDSVIRRLRLVSQAQIFSAILEEFFILEKDGWHNLRADSEILIYNDKADRARENGRKGGRPKKNKGLRKGENQEITKPVFAANPEETESKANQEPVTKNQEPRTIFNSAWEIYPKREGGNPKKDAEQAWNARVKEGASPDELMEGLYRYREYCEKTKTTGSRFVLQGKTFFGPSERFKEEWRVNNAQGNSTTQQPRLTARERALANLDELMPESRGAIEASFERLD